MEAINLQDKLDQFDERWAPRIVGALNGQHVKLAKLEGAFDWHQHADADELFLVLDGRLIIVLRDGSDVRLGEGECCIVPRGTEHRPVAPEGAAHVLLVEPAGTRNTGRRETEKTVSSPEWI
ncbi:MAG: cupin domain-containing protein [Salinibacter sp.]